MERKAITSRESLTIKRHFSTEGIDPFSAVKWVKRDISIMGRDKIPVFERAGVLVPENWSSNAAQIVVSKYCSAVENVHDLIKRVVDTIAGWGRDDTYFETQADTEAFRSELAELLLTQKAAFNSPVYFNVGRKKDPQCSACFILSAPDSMEGIMELATTEARLFKQGSGCGSNLSTIRSSCEALSGGGTASGPISFMQGLDTFAGAVKSGGTTRRAAKMVVLNVDHPDIESFIDVKKEAEEDARVLSAAGRVGTLDAPKVFFQNANHSVRITDAFMRAVQEDASWPLIAVTTNDVVAEIPARTLFTKIAEAAWDCGDPGVQFHDSVNRWHTCPEDGDITGSNPCGEYMFLEESACNLASLNLCTFLDSDGTFNVESFSQAVRIMFTAQEILIDRSSYPTEAITHNSRQFRPLGLGYANLGALLMRLGIPYDSEKGRATSACITALMGGVAYAHSAEMARSKGACSHCTTRRRSQPNSFGDTLAGCV